MSVVIDFPPHSHCSLETHTQSILEPLPASLLPVNVLLMWAHSPHHTWYSLHRPAREKPSHMLHLLFYIAHFLDPFLSRTLRELSALDISISFIFILSYATVRGCSSLLLHREALVKDSENPFFGKSTGQFLVLLGLDQPAALNKLISPFLKCLFHLACHIPFSLDFLLPHWLFLLSLLHCSLLIVEGNSGHVPPSSGN